MKHTNLRIILTLQIIILHQISLKDDLIILSYTYNQMEF